MEIVIAENPAFCYGVERAYRLAKEQKGQNIFTWGPLIHNPQIVAELKQQGIEIVEQIEQLEKGDTVIIRAHGVSDKLKNKLQKKGIKIIDGTCPFVTKAHLIAKKMVKDGLQLVIIGDKNHPEIKGILEDFEGVIVLNNREEIENCTDNLRKRRLGIISQTTKKVKEVEEMVEMIKKINVEMIFENTICNATYAKQNAAKKLAKEVGVMLVVGGKNSNNTKMLQQICSDFCPSYLISEVDEIERKWLEGCKKIGITGGASTPLWLIEEVKNYLS